MGYLTNTILALGCGAVLGGCSTSSGLISTTAGFPTEPAFATYDEGRNDHLTPDGWFAEPIVGWIEEGKTFAIVTWGSSSCQFAATSFKANGEDGIEVHFKEPGATACTADLSPITHTFELPMSVTGRPITISVTGKGTNGILPWGKKLPEVDLILE
ncbi:hypothetical protein V5R04_08375 [Jonesiaceae bacterium BS-20]|uniref:Uncharacterized protein n=1 Tax=Jonesiaceae bacterium BS-20 TaxID=3120821 RepID=A0AAU7DSQ4_9MICO